MGLTRQMSSRLRPSPRKWGPPFWATLHYAALGYPDEPDEDEAAQYLTFVESFVNVIPCAKCKSFAWRTLSTTRDELLSALRRGGDALYDWTVMFHDLIKLETLPDYTSPIGGTTPDGETSPDHGVDVDEVVDDQLLDVALDHADDVEAVVDAAEHAVHGHDVHVDQRGVVV